MSNAAENDRSPVFLLLACFMNTGAILYFIRKSMLKGWKLAGVIFILGFGLMYFMAQIETLWFNDSVKFPITGIFGLVTGGAIMFMLFSITATWMTGGFKSPEKTDPVPSINISHIWKQILILAVVVWPLLYFSAGYLIAWQFEAVRLYYTGSSEKESFFFMLFQNLGSSLYLFQILRGILWILLALLAIKYIKGGIVQKGISLVLLMVFLCCGQLIIPNPFMPETVRIAHLIETSTENAIWAVLIVWVLEGIDVRKGSQLKEEVMSPDPI